MKTISEREKKAPAIWGCGGGAFLQKGPSPTKHFTINLLLQRVQHKTAALPLLPQVAVLGRDTVGAFNQLVHQATHFIIADGAKLTGQKISKISLALLENPADRIDRAYTRTIGKLGLGFQHDVQLGLIFFFIVIQGKQAAFVEAFFQARAEARPDAVCAFKGYADYSYAVCAFFGLVLHGLACLLRGCLRRCCRRHARHCQNTDQGQNAKYFVHAFSLNGTECAAAWRFVVIKPQMLFCRSQSIQSLEKWKVQPGPVTRACGLLRVKAIVTLCYNLSY